ncbi:glutaredoxin family protein [Pampinifervens florentissimum]|uniref:glutaredoxin family protein n=1 Tax=Pampinifervens florentissimum TaxID=1632019 RepID=UPI0013B48D6B|nr:thioredoxin family protein [Hydrogenobacter sp. T-8]QID33064.1 thioredoxin family protein [Hydrogenobacter sp. T-8]
MLAECLILLFTQTGCSSCNVAKHYLERMSMPYRVVSIEENRELARMYGVWGSPTLVLIKGNAVISRYYGFNPEGVKDWYKEKCSS